MILFPDLADQTERDAHLDVVGFPDGEQLQRLKKEFLKNHII